MTRPHPSARADYPFFTRLHTRWDDNDIYGHLNNTVHYKLMDTAVNGWLLDHVGLDIARAHAVDPYAAGQLQGQGAGQVDHGGLGAGVDAARWEADQAGIRTQVDDVAATGLQVR